MDGDLTFEGSSIPASDREMVLAVDRVRSWGAAFEFWASADGMWSAGTIWTRQSFGHWEEMGRGGSHGDAWPTPWRVPEVGWDGNHLMVMGISGLDVEEGPDDLEFQAVIGFASPRVASIRIEDDGHSRFVAPTPSGAFCALAVCRDGPRLTAFDDAKAALPEPWQRLDL